MKKGSDNIISNGSVIAVADGQCMIIVDQGGIVEFCADAGEFVYGFFHRTQLVLWQSWRER